MPHFTSVATSWLKSPRDSSKGVGTDMQVQVQGTATVLPDGSAGRIDLRFARPEAPVRVVTPGTEPLSGVK